MQHVAQKKIHTHQAPQNYIKSILKTKNINIVTILSQKLKHDNMKT
jgi:hypothetical protein